MTKKTGDFLRLLRTESGTSQAEVAKKIGLSRSSYVAVEQGERELQLGEAQMLSQMFVVSIEELLAGKRDKETPVVLETKAKKSKAKEMVPEERISVPQEQVEKFKSVLLYILQKVGGKPNIGLTAIYKLLYFIDFDYYEKYETQLIGARYMKNTHGPTPIAFKKIVNELEREGKIEELKSKFYTYEQTKYLINPEIGPDLSILNAQELAHIDWELERLSSMTARQLSDLSHKDTPWYVAKEKAILDYEHVFYRPEETSVREYEPL